MAETLPPLTADDIREPIKNLSFSVYIYIGKAEDQGWENARLAFSLLARHRVYLAASHALVREWCGGGAPRGIVFGWDDAPRRYLNDHEAADFKTVMIATTEARKG